MLVTPTRANRVRGRHKIKLSEERVGVSLLTLRVARFPISILISALVLVGVLLFPGPAYGVGVTVDTGSTIGDESFALGSTLSFTLEVALAADEFLADSATLTLAIAASTSSDTPGPETVTLALPVEPGAFTVTDTGSQAGTTLDNVTVTGTVTHDSGVSAGDFTGYGYGYGYLGASGGGTLTYALNFSHRVLRDPAPTILPTLPASENLFTVNVAGAVGATTQQQGGGDGIPNFPDFQFGGGIFAPGTPYDAQVRGLAAFVEGPHTKVGAIVDGFQNENDVYVKIGQDQWGSFSEYSLNFPNTEPAGWSFIPDLSGIEALSITSSGQILVAGGNSQTNGVDQRYLLKYSLTCSGSGCSGGQMPDDMTLLAALDINSALGTGTRVGGLAVDLGDNTAYVSDFQESLQENVTVLPVALASGLVAGTALSISLGQVGYAGFDGLAHNSETDTLYGSVGPDGQGNAGFMEFDTSGFPLATTWVDSTDYDSWPSDNYNKVSGLAMALESDKPILFAVAASEGKDLLMSTLAAAAVSASAGQYTNRATFVDEDPETGKVYVGVDGSPDRIQIFTDDTASGAITTLTSSDVEGGTLVSGVSGADNVLWVVDNSTQGPTLRKIQLSDGTELDNIALAGYVGEAGGLAHFIDADGVVNLVIYEKWNDQFHIVSTQSEQISQTLQVNDSNYMDQVWPPGGGNAAAIYNNGTVNKLLVGRFGQVYQISMANGDLETVQNVQAFELAGLGFDGADLVFVNSDYVSEVKGALLSGGVAQSLTVEGDYVMTATTTSSAGATTSAGVNFTLAKLAQVVITITSPAEAAVFNTTTVDVVGTVNDPTVTAITLAKGLASGNLVGKSLTEASDFSTSADNDTYTKTGLWKFTGQFPDFNSDSNKVAALSQGLPSNPNYNVGGVVQGKLETKEISISGADTTLSFDYWYSTEPTPQPGPGWGLNEGYDRKKVLFCETGGSCTLLAHIVSIVEDPMSSMMGMMGGMMGGGGGGGGAFYFEPPPGTQYLPAGVTIGMTFQVDGETAIWIPRGRGSMEGGTRVMTPVEISLAAFNGKTGTIKFKFHSGDDFNQSPDEQGIVVDNVAVNGPITEGDETAVANGAFSLSFVAPEGTVTTKFIASSTVTGTASGETTLTTVVDTLAPTLVLTAPTSPTTFLSQQLAGSFTESSPTQLEVYVNSALKSKSTNLTANDTFSVVVGLSAGVNAISVVLTDDSGQTDTEYATITVDNTTPTITASVVPILSSSVVRPGDSFFVVVNATDSSDANQNTGIATVTHDMGVGAITYAGISTVAEVIQKKHSLTNFGASSTATTHVVMGVVPDSAAAGSLPVTIDALDGAGNTGTATINLTVVSDLPDRTGFLREGFNFIGFPLVPSTSTFDDLLDQEITNANAALTTALGRTPKLSDVVESVFTWSGGPGTAIGSLTAGSFLSYTPSASADTLTSLTAKMGLLVNVAATVTVSGSDIDVFDTAENPTVSAGSDVTVPIAWNVIGEYLPSGQATPPVKTVKTGFNLVTVHAPTDTQSFDNVFRGALVPNARAISATTSQNEVNAIYDASEPGNISTLLNEGAELLFPTDTLAVMRSYWLQLADDPDAAVDPQI